MATYQPEKQEKRGTRHPGKKSREGAGLRGARAPTVSGSLSSKGFAGTSSACLTKTAEKKRCGDSHRRAQRVYTCSVSRLSLREDERLQVRIGARTSHKSPRETDRCRDPRKTVLSADLHSLGGGFRCTKNLCFSSNKSNVASKCGGNVKGISGECRLPAWSVHFFD